MSPERQPVGKNIPDGGGSLPELAAAFGALGHPVALKIIEKLLEPEPPSSNKRKKKWMRKLLNFF